MLVRNRDQRPQDVAKTHGTDVLALVGRIHTFEACVDTQAVSLQAVESNIVRCPDGAAAVRMIKRIEEIGREGDYCGGVIECVLRRPPVGLGMSGVRQAGG
jgi:chorismate synthase